MVATTTPEGSMHGAKRMTMVLVVALIAAACSSSSSEPASSTASSTTAGPAPTEAPTPTDAPPSTEFTGTIDLDLEAPERCEFLGESCLLPFPSDGLTVEADSVTGRLVDLSIDSMPSNVDEVPVDTTFQNLNDGFSPGSAALVLLPGVDLESSGAAPITDIARSLDDDSPVVVIDATTGERWPHWVELDANATDPDRTGLFIRPAMNYPAGHRIVIGIRAMVDAAGTLLEPTDAFVAYRDRLESTVPEVEARRPAIEAVFADLAGAGVGRDDLQLAWDFTVISTESLTGPLLAMRDDAFDILGAAAPTFTVNSVAEEGAGSSDDGAGNEVSRRVIEGTYEVPLYLTGDGTTGNGLNRSTTDGPIEVNGTWTAPFRCQITETTTADDPGPGVIYGHGLLGDEGQVTSSGPTMLAREHNYVVCGTPLIGMAEEDAANAVTILQETGTFFTLADRLLQGHLNTLFLGRLMRHEAGFVVDPAFRAPDDRPLLANDELYYYGISQGGIMGPASTAVSFDWDRAALGVPGVNYSTLLNRSIDFDLYQEFLDPAYPDKLDQALVLLVVQMLWDRGEGNGYIEYFGDNPLPGVEPKTALLHPAFGDHQVANVATDVLARTLGASIVCPGLASGRSTDVEPFWAIPCIESYPYVGSAMAMWDSGQPAPPQENLPPREGQDPHGDPRVEPRAVEQIAGFLSDGAVIDTCDGVPCTAEPG